MTENIINNGATTDDRLNNLPAHVLEQLAKPLDPKLIHHRPGAGGRRLDYLPSHIVRDQANKIFGHGCWSYTTLEGPTKHEITTLNPKTGEMFINAEYFTARVQVSIMGQPLYDDIGFASVRRSNNGAAANPEMYEVAQKAAISDAFKRAMRNLGPQFGNSLYDPNKNHSLTAATPAEAAAVNATRTNTPVPTALPAANNTAGLYACPKHGAGAHIQQGKNNGRFYCSKKDNTKPRGYCDLTPQVAATPANIALASGEPTKSDAPTKTDIVEHYYDLCEKLGYSRDYTREGYKRKNSVTPEDATLNQLSKAVDMAVQMLNDREDAAARR